MTDESLTYRSAGVDIDAGNELVERIKPQIARTARSGVLGGFGGFGGLFELPIDRFRQPVLVSGTDGVGTKLMLANRFDDHSTIGIDLVAMCVNDILVCGAEPLYFLDYLATGRLDVDKAASVVAGIAEGCVQAGAALIGGETAEMPDMYSNDDYDLAGFAVGVVEKSRIIDGSAVRAGDVVLGIASSGLHSNGYSLVRRILDRANASGYELVDNMPLSRALLTPTRIYVKSLLPLLASEDIHGLVHVTGGGLTENLPRVLPQGVAASLQRERWPESELFTYLQREGNISDAEMLRTFNCGIGMVLIVAAEQATSVSSQLTASGEQVYAIGEIVNSENSPAVLWSQQ